MNENEYSILIYTNGATKGVKGPVKGFVWDGKVLEVTFDDKIVSVEIARFKDVVTTLKHILKKSNILLYGTITKLEK